MISGYNTDVPHADVVFHVQTEDKGLSAAWIESLVYVGGQVIARRRSSYKGFLDEGQGKQAVSELMNRQHRLMIAEIRSGKFDGQLAGLGRGPAPGPAVAAASEVALPPAAPTVLERFDGGPAGPTLDQVILEYLTAEAEQEHLVLMMEADGDLGLGSAVGVRCRTVSSLGERPVAGSRIVVRMISTVSEPVTLAEGTTGDGGEVSLTLTIPELDQGTGALIVTASSDIGSAEIKHLL